MKNLKRKSVEINLHQINFNLICDKYDLKNNEDYFYFHNISKRYMCSQKLIDFVTKLLYENNNLIDDIKNENKKWVNPRGKGFLNIQMYTYSYSGTQPYPSQVNSYLI